MGKWPKGFAEACFIPAKKIAGIYTITCVVTGKVYVGSSCNMRKRWHKHLYELRKGVHYNQHLMRAWLKYGEDCFEFSIIEIVLDRALLIEREQYFMDLLKPDFNYSSYAASTRLGVKSTEQSKQKMRLKMIGRTASPEAKKNMGIAQKQRFASEAERENARQKTIAHFADPKNRERLRTQQTGFKHTETSKKKISNANQVYWTEERKAEARKKELERLAAGGAKQNYESKLYSPSIEIRQKISKALQGKAMLEATKQRLHEGREKFLADPERRKRRNTNAKKFWENNIEARRRASDKQLAYLERQKLLADKGDK